MGGCGSYRVTITLEMQRLAQMMIVNFTVSEGDWFCHDCDIFRAELNKAEIDTDGDDQIYEPKREFWLPNDACTNFKSELSSRSHVNFYHYIAHWHIYLTVMDTAHSSLDIVKNN